MKRRLFSLLLALVMCLSLLPTAALAEEVTTPDGDTTGSTGIPDAAALPAPQLSTYAGSSHFHTDGIGISDAISLKDIGTQAANKHCYLTNDITITSTLEIKVDNVELCLNGHTISMSADGPVITVLSSKTFTLTDCGSTSGSITHAEDKAGCGVKVNGTFKMTGGSITGNNDYEQHGAGGGVYVAPGGEFELSGGKITNNSGTYDSSSRYGGGVYLAPVYEGDTKATFTMTGGTIGGTGEYDGNSAKYGGGVYVGRNATFSMTGGSITGNSGDKGGGVYVDADSITVGGSANITGNKNNDEKLDNVHLRLNTKVSVNSVFSGSVGINVDVAEWKATPTGESESNGKNWTAVAGNGLSAAVTGNMITYDGGEFAINGSSGKLSCLHVCGTTESQGLHCCEICKKTVTIKTEFKNAAGTNTVKTQYYENAATAFQNAENNCVITLLTAAEFNNGYTWNLDGKSVTLNADYVLKNLIVQNGTLNLGYTRDVSAYYIEKMVVGSGATVNVDVKKSGFSGTPSLTVQSGGKVEFTSGHVGALQVESGGTAALKGGTFDSITVAEGMTCAELLADGYAFFESNDNNAALVKADGATLSSRTTAGNKQYYWVKSHSCDFKGKPICGCGRKCPHSSIDFTTGKCSTCNEEMAGVLVSKTADGTTTTQIFDTFNAAVESITTGDTNVTIKLMGDATFEDTETGEDTTTQFTVPCTLDLNGKTLTVKEKRFKSDEGDGHVETVDGSLEIETTVTITDTSTGTTAGSIVSGVSVFYYNDPEEGETKGSLTVTGNVSISKLWVNAGAEVNLSSGTYGNVSGNCTAGDLLADGYAFQKTEGSSFVRYDTKIISEYSGGTPLTDVKVVECETHSIAEAGKCEWCNKLFAVKRTIGRAPEVGDESPTMGYFATLSEAMTDIENNETVTIELLADVTEQNGENNKQIEIGKNINLTLDLSGKTLTADIKVTSNATLTMRSSGTLAGTLQVVDGSAALSGGTFKEIKVESDKTVGGLLANGCGYQYTNGENNGTWSAGEMQSIQNVSVKAIPIQSVSVAASPESITYGSTAILTASASGAAADATVSYQWYDVVGTDTGTIMNAINDATSATYTTSASLDVGRYAFCCEATVDGYTVKSNNVTVAVNKATLTPDSGSSGESGSQGTATYTAPVPKTSLTYTGEAQQLIVAGNAPSDCKIKYRLDPGNWVSNAGNITATDAGSYTVYWYIVGDNHYNDVGSATEPESLTVEIAKKTIGSGDITVTGEEYTGEAIKPEITVKVGGVTLEKDTHYTVSGDTEKTDAGTYSVTITGTGNYAGTHTVNWTITRKTLTLSNVPYIVYAKKNETPTANLAQIAKTLGMPDNDGELTFYNGDTQITALPAADTTTTHTLTVRSTNHEASIQIQIVVSDKTVPTVSVSDYNEPYSGAEVAAQTVAETATVTADGVNGQIAGTWSWTNGKAPKTVADSGRYSLTFTPTDSSAYSSVTTTVQVTITKKTVTLSNLTAQKVYDGTAAVNASTVLSLSFSDDLKLNTDYTITASFDNANAGTGKTVTATVKLTDSAAENYCFAGSDGAPVNETTITSTGGCITQKKLTIGSCSAGPKYYDGTVRVDSYSAALDGFVEAESNRPKLGTDYTITAAFDSADAGTGKTVTITVTLSSTEKAANYCFEVNGSASRTIQVETTATIYPLSLGTMPTVKESVVKLTQDVTVRSGSYPLPDNVNVALPEYLNLNLDLSRELRFALGTLPAKVTAQIDADGVLSYTITGGKVGEKLAIPVTVTAPNLVYHEQGNTAAAALYAQNELDGQTPQNDADAGTINLSFTVEVELTGRSYSSGVGSASGGGDEATPPELIKDDHFAYMQGDNNGNFRPDANLTRAEAAAIFYNLLVDKRMGSSKLDFTDVKGDEWYAAAVKALASRGILGGYEDGSFRPLNSITRAEFAAIVSRFDALSAGAVTFKDVTPDHWAYSCIGSAAAKGWITGYEDHTFRPDNNITRAEAVTLVNKVLGRAPDQDFIDQNIDEIKRFKDVTTAHWAYYNIIEAANGHAFTKDSKGNEFWKKLQ